MTLPASGEITLNDVNVELGNTGTDAITIGSADVRDLFGVASGEITMADGYGKSSVYSIDNSCRFNDNDSAYLSRTPSAGNRRTWTWSGWVKRGNIGGDQTLFCSRALSTSTPYFFFSFNTSTNIFAINSESCHFYTEQKFRDPSAWMHIVVAVDTTQGTNTNRIKVYINGSQVTDTSNVNYPSQNADLAVNHTILHQHGAVTNGAGTRNQYTDGYLADVNFIDGTALTASSFGETGDYGEWKPIEYSGSYGTNGFYLDFADSGNLGDDESGNGNDWTEHNLSATDQMLDTPTNNFATMNPLENRTGTLSQGNLKNTMESASDYEFTNATFGVSTLTGGKWYYEQVLSGFGNRFFCGVVVADGTKNSSSKLYGYVAHNGYKHTLGSQTSYGSSYGVGDVIGIALDMDNGTISFYKNNSSQGTAFTGLSGDFIPTCVEINSNNGNVANFNFGQDSSFAGYKTAQGNQDGNGYGDFYYTPPSGYLALCTANLPDPAVTANEHFDAQIYTGSHSSDQDVTSPTITGVDLVWLKSRSHATNNALFDRLRGTQELKSDTKNNEVEGSSRAFGSLLSNGVELLGSNDGGNINQNPRTYVAWMWKAGGTGVSNTDGSVTSTVSANVDAGFSIVGYTGTGSVLTAGHGLDKAPEFYIVKCRDVTENNPNNGNWRSYHKDLHTSSPQNYFIKLNDNTGAVSGSSNWNNTAPTSTVFTIGTDWEINLSGERHIVYCFHSVDGYSKVGSYTGNSSSDGTFVYLGFRPAFVMWKKINTNDDWGIHDNRRVETPIGNPIDNYLRPNKLDIEGDDGDSVDFLSNGFKWRLSSGLRNNNNDKYLYLAFAETPFKHTNAR